MGLFNRKKKSDSVSNDDSVENKKEKGGWRRPANTAFKQQRLKAWQPILTPKTVLPTFFIIGLLFGLIGGLLIWGSSLVTEMTFDYTDCENLTPSPSNGTLSFSDIPSDKFSYRLRSSEAKDAHPKTPRYAFLDNTNNSTDTDVSDKLQCVVDFDIPIDLPASVFFYYKLTNFFQNHRRYVKSFDSDQLRGKVVGLHQLDESDCKPLSSVNGVAIYPCGLIANSLFNDTYTNPILLNPAGSANSTYVFTNVGISWPGEAKKYVSSPIDTGAYSNLSEIVPPPNWALKFPQGYTDTNPPPDLRTNERFQNWMRTAGLPTFTKLDGRNDQDTMLKGTYRIIIGLNFPVLSYKGTKSFVISTASWIGGKNPFLGWAYVASAGVFELLAVLGTARHLIRPRRLGDMSLLSWNR